MIFEWDEKKNAGNLAKHGRVGEAVHDFDWATAYVTDRSRHADGEARFSAINAFEGKVWTVIFTWRGEGRVRIISFRRSNSKEEKAYAQEAEE